MKILFVLIFFSLPSVADKYTVYKMGELDMAMLPPFCVDWALGNERKTDMWVKRLRIPNIHHFCKGIKHVNRAIITLDKSERIFNSKSGIGEFNYVLKHEDGKSFPLKPFLLVNRAKLYIYTNDFKKAILDYRSAIEENPKFSRAYADLIDLYLKIGRKNEAKSVLGEGLKHIPNSTLLARRKKTLRVK
jgi:tetratricopeptide (TPR) repeat protein